MLAIRPSRYKAGMLSLYNIISVSLIIAAVMLHEFVGKMKSLKHIRGRLKKKTIRNFRRPFTFVKIYSLHCLDEAPISKVDD